MIKFVDQFSAIAPLDQMALLDELIAQLEKDFGLAGVPLELHSINSPKTLVGELSKQLDLISKREPSMLQNLLYRIDIPEELTIDSMAKTKDINVICELILRKEWFKIQFRNRN